MPLKEFPISQDSRPSSRGDRLKALNVADSAYMRSALYAGQDKAAALSDPSRQIMRLNVGGTTFTTTLATLRNREPKSMLSVMAQQMADTRGDCGESGALIDSTGAIFFDRDAAHFSRILNYLRDGTCVMPGNLEQLQELRREAEYYKVNGLVRQLDTRYGLHVSTDTVIPNAALLQAEDLEMMRAEAGVENIAVVERGVWAAYVAGGRDEVDLSTMLRSQLPKPIELMPHVVSVAKFVHAYFKVIQADFLTKGYLVRYVKGSDSRLRFARPGPADSVTGDVLERFFAAQQSELLV